MSVAEAETDMSFEATHDIPSFTDPRYNPHNVRRRENRKKLSVLKLRHEIKGKAKKISILQKQVYKLKENIYSLENQLKDVQKQYLSSQKELTIANKKITKLQKECDLVTGDLLKTELLIEDMEEKLKIDSKESRSKVTDSTASKCDTNFSYQTKSGKIYSPVIRKLYYTLLASQVPPKKISFVIKTVLLAFVPDVDTSTLKLPSESCAGYMRREELKTISVAHQASVISEQIAAGKNLHINTDGTTKRQRKLNATAFNGVVLSVNEVPDGSADAIIDDIENQLEKLRTAAYQLHLPNADMINWTLFCASTSDSASTQKRFNTLLQLRKDKDKERFKSADSESLSIIKNFCAMHLGINLRKAFIAASNSVVFVDDGIDSFVHEFCKLFGCHGTPEYAVGCVQFKDFLTYRADQCHDNQLYYRSCLGVSLSRQIGSRYFVTSYNATKILFLASAALEFLTFTNKCHGNQLERDVFDKLQNSQIITCLQADSLMFYHIFADLVALAKSKHLGKSAYDMKQHYLELKLFLDELIKYPQIVTDQCTQVFVSESKLYTPGSKSNHRCCSDSCTPYSCIQEHLFYSIDTSDELLFSLVSSGATFMKEKLCSYAADFLPGGIYWDSGAEILMQLDPSNDLCESILGLNDYLSQFPNMLQLTKSNLVEIKKNHTMQWLQELPMEKQSSIIELAVVNRSKVREDYKIEQQRLAELRQQKMVTEKEKRDIQNAKRAKELEELSKLHVIKSVLEFDTHINIIDEEDIPVKSKNAKKLLFLKNQVRIRKKLLQQKVTVTFSNHGRSRPLNVLINEVRELIRESETAADISTMVSFNYEFESDPFFLVNRHVLHRFIIHNGESKWYRGFVTDYNPGTKAHTIIYDEESDQTYFYNLLEDLASGDIKVLCD